MEIDYKALKDGGFMRQKQKGRFSVRLKVVGGNLTTAQLRVIADVADRYGVGRAHLTARQGLEIPFIRAEDAAAVRAALAAGGAPTGVCGPRARTVTACQGSEVCPSGCVDSYSLAAEISDRYFGRELPHKFKFGVTGCANNCLKAEENDFGVKGGLIVKLNGAECSLCGLCVEVCRARALAIKDEKVTLDADKCDNCGRCVKSCPTGAWEGQPGYILSFGGSFGNEIAIGLRLTPIVEDRKTLFAYADRAVAFFVKYGKSGERFRKAIDREGAAALKAFLEA